MTDCIKYSAVSGVATDPIVRMALARIIAESWSWESISSAFTHSSAYCAFDCVLDVRKMYMSFFSLKSFVCINFSMSVNSYDTSRPVDMALIISVTTLR